MHTIQLRRCLLRGLTLEDAAELQQALDNPRVAARMDEGFPSPYTLEDAVNFIKLKAPQNPPTTFAVDKKGKVVGYVGIEVKDKEYGEVHACLAEGEWGLGLVVDGTIKLTKYGFEVLGLRRLYARVYGGNTAPMRMLVYAGYRCAGTVKDSRGRDMGLFVCVP